MLNPVCDCGEILVLDDPVSVAFTYFEGSPEIHQLFALASFGVRRVWTCYGCGFFAQAQYANDRRPGKVGGFSRARGATAPRGSRPKGRRR